MTTPKPVLRYGVVGGVFLLAALLLFQAVKMGWADVQVYPVRHEVARWGQVPEQAQKADLEALIERMQQARRWASQDPEYAELTARLFYQRAINNGLGASTDPALEADVQKALDLHQYAASLRPSWPYSWANIALMQAWLGRFDAQWHQALSRAEQRGPWEVGVNLALAEAGFLGWSQLAVPVKQQVLAAAVRAARHHPEALRQLALRYRLLPAVCSELAQSFVQKKVCRVR